MKKVVIYELENGFLVEHHWKTDTGEETESFAVETSEELPGDGIEKLLLKVNELIGIRYDSFMKNNLNITWNKKGDEVE